jgi:hypothetical protein
VSLDRVAGASALGWTSASLASATVSVREGASVELVVPK